MDFAFTDEQQAFSELASQIFADGATPDRQREVEQRDGPRFDRALWQELASAGLLGIAVPEAYGGADQTFFELASLVEQVGRYTAPVPVVESLVLGALPVAAFGSDAQKDALLPGVVDGSLVLTAALVEEHTDPMSPATRAEADGDGYRVSGTKMSVPAGPDLRPHPRPGEPRGWAHRDLRRGSVGRGRLPSRRSTPPPASRRRRSGLDGVRLGADALLGDPDRGAEILAWMLERATAALCSLALGVCEEALRITADYTKTREQFGAALATFQAVGQRQADAYVDTEAIRLTSWQAAWRLGASLPAGEAGRGREVLGRDRRPACRAHRRPPARRHGRRPRLSSPPVLPLRQAARARSRRREPPAPGAREDARRRNRLSPDTPERTDMATPPVAPGAETRSKGALPILFGVVVIDLIGFGIVIPILPFYAKGLAASGATLGLLLATHAALQFAFAPVWGRLSDRIGRRPVMLITMAGTSVALFLLGRAESVAMLFVARALSRPLRREHQRRDGLRRRRDRRGRAHALHGHDRRVLRNRLPARSGDRRMARAVRSRRADVRGGGHGRAQLRARGLPAPRAPAAPRRGAQGAWACARSLAIASSARSAA